MPVVYIEFIGPQNLPPVLSVLQSLEARNCQTMRQVVSGIRVLKDHSGSCREKLLINLTLALYEHRLGMADELLSKRQHDGQLN